MLTPRRAVFYLHRQDRLFGRAARGLWQGDGGHGRDRQDGIGRQLPAWHDVKARRD